MARKKAMTPEERLAAALVPEAEQPYPVPENWHWVRGKAILKGMKSTSPKGATFRYVDIDSIDNKRQVVANPKTLPTEKAPSRASRLLGTGDTLFSMVRPYLRNIAYIDDELSDCIGSTGFYVCKPASCLVPRYLYHLMRSDYVVMGLSSFMKGDNSPSIRKGDIDSFPFPLPPLPEQDRIVARVESLFSKLDEAEAKLTSVLDAVKTRRLAILHTVFSGNEDAEELSLGDVCHSIFDGDHMPPPKAIEGVPFLVISDINTGSIRFEMARFVPQSYYDALTATRKPERGDVLYTLVGSYGIPVLVDTDRPFCFQRHMALLKPDTSHISSDYLRYLLSSPQAFEKATEIATGTAQLTVPIRGLRKMSFKIPPLSEQRVITHHLDHVFTREDASAEKVHTALEAIDTLRQTILAKALHGELGTNDPEEESVLESALELDGLSR